MAAVEKLQETEVAPVASNNDDSDIDGQRDASEPKVGELRPGEAEAGGLGRHLGLFSTTFLMFVVQCRSTYPSITDSLLASGA